MQTNQNKEPNPRTPYLLIFTPSLAFLWISSPAAIGAGVLTLILFLIFYK